MYVHMYIYIYMYIHIDLFMSWINHSSVDKAELKYRKGPQISIHVQQGQSNPWDIIFDLYPEQKYMSYVS